MQSKTYGGVTVVFDPEELETSELINDACPRALQIIQEKWGLDAPKDCRISVMTSWWKFIFQSAPWPWRLLLLDTMPFWYFRVKRTWPYSAGWTQRFGKRVAVGIKPPRLLERSDKSIGARLFEEEKDMKSKVRHLTCHELTHACSAHLKLPMWLNEGIATVTVDRFLEKRTVRREALDLVKNYQPKSAPPTYRELSRASREAMAYHTVRGYWLVQYLEAKRPGLLKRLLTSPRESWAIENEIAKEMGLEPAHLWSKIDDIMVAHFGKAPGIQ
jgi:hypothetical protein